MRRSDLQRDQLFQALARITEQSRSLQQRCEVTLARIDERLHRTRSHRDRASPSPSPSLVASSTSSGNHHHTTKKRGGNEAEEEPRDSLLRSQSPTHPSLLLPHRSNQYRTRPQLSESGGFQQHHPSQQQHSRTSRHRQDFDDSWSSHDDEQNAVWGLSDEARERQGDQHMGAAGRYAPLYY